LLGFSGVVYEIVVVRRMRLQTAYAPVFEDWLFHVLLPFVGYATIAVSAFTLRVNSVDALFAAAAAVLVLLFTGIHNAWDAVTYHVFSRKPEKAK
jgi:hypothetical protein